MPEAPAILYLRDQLLPFKGKIVKHAGGYNVPGAQRFHHKKLLDVCTWGKHLLFVFKDATIKVHLMLFGRVVVNDRSNVNRAFFLEFASGEINGYLVKVAILEGKPEAHYDWRTDILHHTFSASYVMEKMMERPSMMLADVLMDQSVFTGVGNKIRNEALYAAGLHPFNLVSAVPERKLKHLVAAVRKTAAAFYKDLSRTGVHNKFSVYKKEYTPTGSAVTQKKLPKGGRKIYFSEHEQELF